MNKRAGVLVLTLLGVMLLSTACGGSVPTKVYELGDNLTIEYPENWMYEDDTFEGYGFVVFSTDEENLDEGMGFAVFLIPTMAIGDDYDISSFLRDFATQSDFGEIGDVTSKSISGVTWQKADFEYEDEIDQVKGWMAASKTEDMFIILVAASPPDSWGEYQSIYDQMFKSVQVK